MRGLKRREHLYLVAAPGLESGGGLRGGDADVRPGGRRSLIGRAADVERVLEALASPGLVTITGPGGIGKTRLIREIRERVVDDDDRLGRSAMVELAGARDGAAVESAFADALLHDDALGHAGAGGQGRRYRESRRRAGRERGLTPHADRDRQL